MKRERNTQKKYAASLVGILLIVFAIVYGCRVYAGAAVTGTVTASTLFMRTGPSVEYAKVMSNGKTVYLSRGDSVAISYSTNGWYYVTASFEGTRVNGFVSAAYVIAAGAVPTAAPTNTPTPRPTGTPTPTPKPTSSPNEVLLSGFPRPGTVTASSLKVREDAGTSAAQLTSVKRDTVLSLQGVKKDSSGKYWYQVSVTTDGVTRTGYVSSEYIKVAAPTATPTPTATPLPTATPEPDTVENVVNGTFPRTGTVTASSLNVRRDAGTEHTAVTSVSRGTTVSVLSARKDSSGEYWYQISFTQDAVKRTGYVHSRYIAVAKDVTPTTAPTPTPQETTAPQETLTPTPTPTTAPQETPAPTTAPQETPMPTPTPVISGLIGEPITKEEVERNNAEYYYLAKVTAYQLNLRKEPSSSADKITQISQNTQIMVINEELVGDFVWYRVAIKLDGIVVYGYMSSEYVALLYDDTVAGTVSGTRIRMRDKASVTGGYVKTDANSIISLNEGDSVTILSETTVDGEKWFRISVEEAGKAYSGYVQAVNVRLAAVPEMTPEPTQVPTGVPTPTPEPTAEPTAEPTTAPEASVTPTASPTPAASAAPTPTAAPVETPAPTATPKPTATPIPTATPTPTGLPTPKLIKVNGENYPVNMAGTLTGYGRLSESNRTFIVYETPGEPYSFIRDASGYIVCITDETTLYLYDRYRATDGNTYWHVGFKYNGRTYYGYVAVLWINTVEEDTSLSGSMTGSMADFEYYLDQQGFPESYKPYLRTLHAKYPNWVFEAYHTGLIWDKVIEEESIAGKNLIPNSKSVEWKSLETGAYDWTRDTFILYDGSTWVTASEAAVAYYMDPRNFLKEDHIFMFEVLRYAPEYQDADGVETILKSTPFYKKNFTFVNDRGVTEVISYADTFIAAAQYSGVSPYHLASRVKQEVVTSATTASNSVSGTVSGYTGLYNFYNIGAYHSTVAGGAIINGLKYAKNGASNNDELNDASLIPWTNQYRAIVGGAHILGVNYINRGQDTIYLQKFNVTDTSTYYHQYMANVEAPYSESKKTASAYADMMDLPIVFSIPVYLLMPEEPVKAPAKQYNPNNWLKTLELYNPEGKELQLTPTFDLKTDQQYFLVVEEGDFMVQVEAEAVSSKASVTGTGFYALLPGSNSVTVTVTAENGDVREYEILIIRQE